MFDFDKLRLFLLLDDDDDDIILLIPSQAKRKLVYNRSWYLKTLIEYDDLQFRAAFRMNKSCLNFIMEKFFSEIKMIDSRRNRRLFHMLIYYTAHNITY